VKSIRNMTQMELGAYVQSHLAQKGIEVVLSGGSVVAFYSRDRYVSKDLDFVNIRFVKRSKIRDVMLEIHFIETDRYFRHSESPYLIEFPPEPLTVG